MALKTNFIKLNLKFKFEAGTSRGVLKDKDTWVIKVWDDSDKDTFGVGEAAPLKGLSIDDIPNFNRVLEEKLIKIELCQTPKTAEDVTELIKSLELEAYPSIEFAIETALGDFIAGGSGKLIDNDFTKGKQGLPINGLIWMGSKEFMLQQIEKKLAAGYRCLKMKIGAIDFDKECDVLDNIRQKYNADELVLRVDANGAFPLSEVMYKLKELERFEIHSIEQPIKAGQWEAMADLCRVTRVPIALDEELIGVKGFGEKWALLNEVSPQYIILKPTLIGGIRGTKEWIDMAEQMHVGWWITSALESNVGLNAIAQLTSTLDAKGPQGLGTGQLYTNNIQSPLEIRGDELFYSQEMTWELPIF